MRTAQPQDVWDDVPQSEEELVFITPAIAEPDSRRYVGSMEIREEFDEQRE